MSRTGVSRRLRKPPTDGRALKTESAVPRIVGPTHQGSWPESRTSCSIPATWTYTQMSCGTSPSLRKTMDKRAIKAALEFGVLVMGAQRRREILACAEMIRDPRRHLHGRLVSTCDRRHRLAHGFCTQADSRQRIARNAISSRPGAIGALPDLDKNEALPHLRCNIGGGAYGPGWGNGPEIVRFLSAADLQPSSQLGTRG